MTRTRILAAASAAAALVAFPAAASAATTTITGTNITVAGDATAENIVIADNGQFITVDGAVTAAQANNTFNLTVTAQYSNQQGLFAKDRYILPEQIARLTKDGIQLNVTKDALIKRPN